MPHALCVSIITVALLNGWAVGVMGQEERTAPSTYVTGTVVEQVVHGEDAGEWEKGGVLYRRDWLAQQDTRWSDPRFPSTHWIRMDFTLLEPGDPDSATAIATSNLLEGPEESWAGTGREVGHADGSHGYVVLIGEQGHEGLYALLRSTLAIRSDGTQQRSIEWFIFESSASPLPGRYRAARRVVASSRYLACLRPRRVVSLLHVLGSG